jgi:hypothetical protein
MRQACRDAYPNPLQYCRIHINSIVAHSNRATAAVCLKMGGATDEKIAFRLRWHISSVPTYLRECITSIDALMQQAIAGAIFNGQWLKLIFFVDAMLYCSSGNERPGLAINSTLIRKRIQLGIYDQQIAIALTKMFYNSSLVSQGFPPPAPHLAPVLLVSFLQLSAFFAVVSRT